MLALCLACYEHSTTAFILSKLSQVFSPSCSSNMNYPSLFAVLCHLLCAPSCILPVFCPFLLQTFRRRLISLHDYSGQGSLRISCFHADLSAVHKGNRNAFWEWELLCLCRDLRTHLRRNVSSVLCSPMGELSFPTVTLVNSEDTNKDEYHYALSFSWVLWRNDFGWTV